jgi:heat shock protein HtpX
MAKRVLLFLATNLLVVLTVSLILGVAMPFLGIQVGGDVWGLGLFCGVFGMVGAFISLAISRWSAKRAYRIQLVDESHPMHQLVARLARDAGLPATPEVGIYESPEPNAFATGPRKEKALIAFSSGLLSNMDRSEVEAVAAHEVSHIANGDMVTMALLMGVANALVMFVARLAAFAIDNFLRSDDGDGGLGFFGYIMVVMLLESVLMVFAYVPIAYFSRQREYRADHGAAGLVSPGAMVRALQTLAEARPTRGVAENHAMALAKIHSRKRVSLWSTHPSTEERIQRLQTYTG